MIGEYHVIVSFGTGIASDTQGVVMLALERMLRERGIPAEVFKESREDDSKLRRSMTPLERSRL